MNTSDVQLCGVATPVSVSTPSTTTSTNSASHAHRPTAAPARPRPPRRRRAAGRSRPRRTRRRRRRRRRHDDGRSATNPTSTQRSATCSAHPAPGVLRTVGARLRAVPPRSPAEALRRSGSRCRRAPRACGSSWPTTTRSSATASPAASPMTAIEVVAEAGRTGGSLEAIHREGPTSRWSTTRCPTSTAWCRAGGRPRRAAAHVLLLSAHTDSAWCSRPCRRARPATSRRTPAARRSSRRC